MMKSSPARTDLQMELRIIRKDKIATCPDIFIPRCHAKPTIVYETYWRFASERQKVFFNRMRGTLPPWSQDPVIQKYKFTNVYRASDRVSQYLIREVIYKGDNSPQETFFRTILFKLFNRISTWELLTQNFGEVSFKDFEISKYDKVLSKAMESGSRLYSAAYIMPSGGTDIKFSKKHRMHLWLLDKMMRDHLPARLSDSNSMKDAFLLLRGYPTIGDFLAYQYITDLNYSSLMDFSEMSFVVPGPGCLSGIRKCFSDLGGLAEAEIVKLMADNQQDEFARFGLTFDSLWGRTLQLIDCQNIFCEVDKYARVVHPEIGMSARSRIKQIFRPNTDSIVYWFPPKWGLNGKIKNGVLNAKNF